MIKERMVILLLGALLDLWIGDPHWLYHPVQAIGSLISVSERLFRRLPIKERWQGLLLTVFVSLCTNGFVVALLHAAYRISPHLGRAMSVVLCWQALAMKSLKTESMKVYEALKAGDVEGAKWAVSMIVGRDTSVLDETGISKAAIETVAENASDGVIAPLFFMLLFGEAGGWFYKAVNTMDSMIGYKNDRYLRFGTAAAKLDDVLNLLPSRLAALSMIATSYLMAGFDGKNAWRIWRRDRYKHASPNSAQTESACAGALHIRLAGDAVYFGKRVAKPTIGDDDRAVEYEDIKRANALLYGSSGLVFLAGMASLALFAGIF